MQFMAHIQRDIQRLLGNPSFICYSISTVYIGYSDILDIVIYWI